MCRILDCLAVAIGVCIQTNSHAVDSQTAAANPPRAHDVRLLVEQFAASPDIVHPVSIEFDRQGRLLVIESHTHFPPPNYAGPKHDRVRILEDTDGDGRADRFTTYFEDTRHTMDIALHPDGSVYLAARNEILRLRDLDNDGRADERQRIAFLETKGDYPHNGLSGLAFDSRGDLYFGMGENLGASYRLIGSDGTVISDQGEGGNVFWCTADGRRLRRVATGFWNPFGICLDIFGRVFAVDNDPDAAPPCRLLHVVEGADFGYQFRYGRSGRHAFQSWYGQLPGTLPMVAGTGEGPCEVISYESGGLSSEYLGDLFVASWADHRIERYVMKEHGASFTADRQPFVQGGSDFRPVGIAVAPDGSLFASDWVLKDYTLHNRGAIWHIRTKDSDTSLSHPRGNPSSGPRSPGGFVSSGDPRRDLLSGHRPLREFAARQLLAGGDVDREFLRKQTAHRDVRVRAAALTSLIAAGDKSIDLSRAAETDPHTGIRSLAVRALAARGEDLSPFTDATHSAAVRIEAVTSLSDRSRLLDLLGNPDPYLRHAAVQRLAHLPDLLDTIDPGSLTNPQQRAGVLLAYRSSGRPEGAQFIGTFLADPDEEIRVLAAKWIADLKLPAYRMLLADRLKDPTLTVRAYLAYLSAAERLDDQNVNDATLQDHFLNLLTRPSSSAALRIMALRQIPANHWRLSVGTPDKQQAEAAAKQGVELVSLDKMLVAARDDAPVQREIVRLLSDHPSSRRVDVLADVARDARQSDAIRADALVGLAAHAGAVRTDLFEFARGDNAVLRDEALRALIGVPVNDGESTELQRMQSQRPQSSALAIRVLGKPFTANRPGPDDLEGWLRRLEGAADADAGRRVFFHAKLANCSRCHRVDGRGQDVGPDLSRIGHTDRRHIVESIVQPGALVAPRYQAWTLATTDGRVRTGMLVRTYLDEYTYIDPQGIEFKLTTPEIADSRPAPSSIMPDKLVDLLTDQELRDLMAYLGSRR